MAHREFIDSQGRRWSVWNVDPAEADRALARARTEVMVEDRSAIRHQTRSLLHHGLASGWLCFEAEEEKRRLAPVPQGWDRLEPDELEGLCTSAEKVRGRTTSD